MKISEVLHRAADVELASDCLEFGRKQEFSCNAADWSNTSEYERVERFLWDLGVNTFSGEQFDEFREGPERQGARYLWLKFAALVAESEGK